MELSLLTLGDLLDDPVTGRRPTEVERHRSLVDQAVAADAAGFASVHLGEHHGSDYHLSCPPVVLAAIAERTEHIRLSTGVALVANLDPVRMAEDYATVDVLSGGRVEIVVGRGSFFARTFDFFGQDPAASAELFDEHLRLLLRLLREEEVSTEAGLRPALDAFTSRPRPVGPLPVWVGGGASTRTVDLAAELGSPLMLPSVFATPAAFVPMVERYRERIAAAGHDGPPIVGACCHAHVADTTGLARERFVPRYRHYWDWVQRLVVDFTPGAPALPFDEEELLGGPAIVGSPEAFLDTVGRWHETLGLDRLACMFDLGGMPPGMVLEQIGVLGAEVVPHLPS